MREEFFEHKDPVALRIAMEIEPEIPVVLIMMGMQGAQSLVTCVNNLRHTRIPIHLVVCIGKSSALQEPLEALALPPWITMSIVGQTSHISDYMAVADIIISKAGSASFCEAIHMQLPVILDGTNTHTLIWEKFNHAFTKNHRLGEVITSYEELPHIIEKFFSCNEHTERIKLNAQKLAHTNTREKIQTRVASMLSPAYLYDNTMLIQYTKNS